MGSYTGHAVLCQPRPGGSVLTALFKNFSFGQQPLKNGKMRGILQDVPDGQPGY
jgi:hypothetical protein